MTKCSSIKLYFYKTLPFKLKGIADVFIISTSPVRNQFAYEFAPLLFFLISVHYTQCHTVPISVSIVSELFFFTYFNNII